MKLIDFKIEIKTLLYLLITASVVSCLISVSYYKSLFYFKSSSNCIFSFYAKFTSFLASLATLSAFKAAFYASKRFELSFLINSSVTLFVSACTSFLISLSLIDLSNSAIFSFKCLLLSSKSSFSYTKIRCFS